MGLSVSLAWFLLGSTVPLSGTVVDEAGRPAAGAMVWLGDTYGSRAGLEVLAAGETDVRGRFRLDRAADLEGRGLSWSPTLWVYHQGHRLGFVEFKYGLPEAEEPVRVTLGPPASTPVRVLTPEGTPAEGVGVRPALTAFEAPRPPDRLLDHMATTADADGRATLDGLAPADLLAIDVAVEGQVVQCLPFDPEAGAATLLPLGRIRARIVSEDPESLAGWTITVWSRPNEPNERGGHATQWARETTDADGRAEFPPMAEGQATWRIEPPEGSSYLAVEKPPAAMIRAGGSAEVEIVIRRGVRVEGVVREEPGGAPIPGITVSFTPLRSAADSVHGVVTNDQGRASAQVPPGTVRFSYSTHELPAAYFLPPGVPPWLDFEVVEGEEVCEFTPPRLREAVQVRGRVLDEEGHPVAGASISGHWNSPEFGRNPNTTSAFADTRGEFTLGSIAPGSQVSLVARVGVRTVSEPFVVDRAGAGDDEPITLRVLSKPTRTLAGRVLDPEGRPVDGATLRVRLRAPDEHLNAGLMFRFESPEDLRTGPDGRYRTPDEVPQDQQAQIEVEADGFEPSISPWVAPGTSNIPDLTLRRVIGTRVVAGRVVDASGEPVAGAEVFRAAGSLRRPDTSTGGDGRFRVEGVPDAPALLFARKEGFHLLARRVDPGEAEVELRLHRLDEPAAAPLRLAEPAVPRDEERAIALELAEVIRRQAPGEWGEMRWRASNEVVALAAPGLMIERIEDQVVSADAEILTALAIGRWEDDPGKALELLDAIASPGVAASVALGVFDRLGSAAAPEFRRSLLERAGVRSLAIDDPGAAAGSLARVADRRFDLGEDDRAEGLVREARARSALPGPNPHPNPQDDLTLALARADLPAALTLLEGKDPRWGHPRDRLRTGIAGRIAAADPAGARRVLGQIEEGGAARARRLACLRMAAGDLASARQLAAEDADPIVSALVPAAAARALAESDPEVARILLREAVGRLGGLVDRPANARPEASLVLARLLPLAERIDPDRAQAVLAMALALRPTPPPPDGSSAPTIELRQQYLDLAELAVRVARYDRDSAEVVFAPVADRLVALHHEFWGLGGEGQALFRVSGAFDGRLARALLDALPEDPTPLREGLAIASHPQHHSKAEARVALARALALPPALRSRDQSPQVADDDWLDALDE